MWKLKHIQAKNLCAFKQLDYDIQQNRTTLIFGNNLDNDSQASNGSGKSAMIEAIAIGIVGESLRKVHADEIINDSSDDAFVSVVLSNDESGERMTVNRLLSRKKTQSIQVIVQSGPYDADIEEISQASVSDYNKYILDKIGLTKDDIYANFILSKHKYTSFLSSSDKDKKEIINRFSNGILVDESLAALQEDMVPVQEELKKAEEKESISSGKVSAINEQIADEIAESTEKSQNKIKRIEDLKGKIASKHEYIRVQNENIRNANSRLNELNDVDQSVQELENADKSIKDSQSSINSLFGKHKLECVDDYVAGVKGLQEELKSLENKRRLLDRQFKEKSKELDSARKAFEEIKKRFDESVSEYASQSSELKESMLRLSNSIDKISETNDSLFRTRKSIENKIASLQIQLAGVISCPKCHHEFTLKNDIDIDDTRKSISDNVKELENIKNAIINNNRKIEEYTEQGKCKRKEYDNLASKKSSLGADVNNAKSNINNIQSEMNGISSSLLSIAGDIEKIQKRIDNTRTEMFDQAFDIIDMEIKNAKTSIDNANININNANGNIKSYEESIKEIEESSSADIIDKLKASKERYEQELNEAISEKEEVCKRLCDYKSQEATFIEFKTHLANTKINDLSRITNEFLERIGSDIRISFSGYTVLKSGKIRDKISISLIRDGVDCGSFDKFSEGEKARVNLANILAMHKLTNVNCLEGKGLDLLILDEILDATDESGLANIFEALNALQLTSLVVSHGNIAENYPYKLIVNKQNGVSFINGETT